MNVILLERMGNLGDIGDEVAVRAGFARNYLIPKGKAVRATAENRAVFEERRADLEKAAAGHLALAQGRAAQLEGLALTIVVKAGEEGTLYGSVGTQDIADKAANSYTKEFLFSLSNSERQLLQQVDDALARIADRRYGVCASCEDPMNLKRLQAVPWAILCITCQEKQEQGLL